MKYTAETAMLKYLMDQSGPCAVHNDFTTIGETWRISLVLQKILWTDFSIKMFFCKRISDSGFGN